MERSSATIFFCSGLCFNHAKFNSRTRDVCPSDAFLCFSHIYFSLAFAYVQWVLTAAIRQGQSHTGLNVKRAELIIFLLGAALWPAGSSFKNSSTLPDAIITTDAIPSSAVQIRSEASVEKQQRCCISTFFCSDKLLPQGCVTRLCGFLFCLFFVFLIVLVVQEKKLRARCWWTWNICIWKWCSASLGLLRQHWQAGGAFICVSQTEKEKETVKPAW